MVSRSVGMPPGREARRANGRSHGRNHNSRRRHSGYGNTRWRLPTRRWFGGIANAFCRDIGDRRAIPAGIVFPWTMPPRSKQLWTVSASGTLYTSSCRRAFARTAEECRDRAQRCGHARHPNAEAVPHSYLAPQDGPAGVDTAPETRQCQPRRKSGNGFGDAMEQPAAKKRPAVSGPGSSTGDRSSFPIAN